ncbi:protein kinase domain-containing protein [Nocardioides lijunqiniae]|uniref:protein kinase domain-containing protein n=1 Tax=Nocardioides lijunqiniae TaxID=2760832 RepID=UPI001878282A|nr:protein kinase [Nocardioides lijunqiniae]
MSPSRVLGGRYRVGEVIGRGGTSVVHSAHDLRTGRRVAVKVLRQELAADPQLASRFRREGQLLAGLRHPAIVTFLDAGWDAVDGPSPDRVCVPFIVMEHVPGRSLRELLKRGDSTLERSISYQLGVLSALEFSHRAGVVHRDIKPANVIITPDHTVTVVDFGIARDGSDPAATLTHAQAFLGTPAYLSPEQARGGTADARSDLYSAGCLLYELLAGRPPFVGDDPVSVAYQHVHEEPATLSTHRPDLAPALDGVLAKALAKSPQDRFQDARAFARALRSAAHGLTPHPGGAHARAVGHDVPLAFGRDIDTGTAALAC